MSYENLSEHLADQVPKTWDPETRHPAARNMHRALWWPYEGELFLMSEIPLYMREESPTGKGTLLRTASERRGNTSKRFKAFLLP